MKITIIFNLLLLSAAYSLTVTAANLQVLSPGNDCQSDAVKSFCNIQAAVNAADEKDSIKIPAGKFYENLTINKSVTLIGSENSPSIIDGASKNSVVHILPGSRVSIINLHIENGRAPNGGGIHNEGSLSLHRSSITNNTATLSGGGIYNARSVTGSLFISESEISNNKSLGDDKYNVKYGGGGIYNNSLLIISDTNISENYAVDNGGAIYSVYSGRHKPTSSQIMAEKIGLSAATKRKSTLFRKTDRGAVRIKKSTLYNNIAGSGGGINLQGVMRIERSSINGNKAINHIRSAGGGIFAHLDTTLSISNTTISHNEANFRGGGLRFYSTNEGSLHNVSIIYNKISMNIGQGAGVFLQNHTKQFSIENSIIAGNSITDNILSDCYGSIHSNGYNFLGSTHNCNWIDNQGDLLGSKHELNPGLTWNQNKMRYYINPDSLVINNASPGGCLNAKKQMLKKDQLGNPRINNSDTLNSRCDIGAIEFTNTPG